MIGGFSILHKIWKYFSVFLLPLPIDMMDHKILWLSIWLGRWRRVVWSIKPWTKKYGAYRDNSAVNIANDTVVQWWLMLKIFLTGIVGIFFSFSVVVPRRSESVYLLGFPTKVSNQRYIVFFVLCTVMTFLSAYSYLTMQILWTWGPIPYTCH